MNTFTARLSQKWRRTVVSTDAILQYSSTVLFTSSGLLRRNSIQVCTQKCWFLSDLDAVSEPRE